MAPGRGHGGAGDASFGRHRRRRPLESALALVSFGWVLEVVVLAVFLAQKSLYDHVARVAKA